MNKADEITMAEKRRIISEERRHSTYLDHSRASADDLAGGRFAKHNPTTVVGASSVSYPTQPETSPSNQLAMMPEEPLIDGTGEGNVLGYAIDRPGEAAAPEPAGDGGLRRKGLRRI
jgi:hypothetical protein